MQAAEGKGGGKKRSLPDFRFRPPAGVKNRIDDPTVLRRSYWIRYHSFCSSAVNVYILIFPNKGRDKWERLC